MLTLVLVAGFYNGPDNRSLGWCEEGDLIDVHPGLVPFLVQEGMVSTDTACAVDADLEEARLVVKQIERRLLDSDLDVLNARIADLEKHKEELETDTQEDSLPYLDSRTDVALADSTPDAVLTPIQREVKTRTKKKA